MILCVVGRGTYYKLIIKNTGYRVIRKLGPADVVYNWGMAGQRFENWKAKKAKWLRGKPILNKPVNNTKWTQLNKVHKAGIPTLESTRELEYDHVFDDAQWLFKPDFSLGGRHIYLVDNDNPYKPVPGYFHKFIPGARRKYEVRVHASIYRPQDEYLVQKRVSDNTDAVTWNHHTGGRFITVNKPTEYRIFRECQEYSTQILETLGVDGGGVDFLVDDDGQIWFLEINFSLGLRLPQTLKFWCDTMERIAAS